MTFRKVDTESVAHTSFFLTTSSAPGNYQQAAEEPAVIKASDTEERRKRRESEIKRERNNWQVQALRYEEVRTLWTRCVNPAGAGTWECADPQRHGTALFEVILWFTCCNSIGRLQEGTLGV